MLFYGKITGTTIQAVGELYLKAIIIIVATQQEKNMGRLTKRKKWKERRQNRHIQVMILAIFKVNRIKSQLYHATKNNIIRTTTATKEVASCTFIL